MKRVIFTIMAMVMMIGSLTACGEHKVTTESYRTSNIGGEVYHEHEITEKIITEDYD